MNINSVADLKKAIRQGPHAWPGGYPIYFITSDGAALAFSTVKKEFRRIAKSVKDKARDGWQVVASDINWEDTELYDDHTGKKIESAYGENPRRKREQTPYQRLKKSGAKSTWYSPDGFSKIEEFDNGERYHHHPNYKFPIRMTPKSPNPRRRRKMHMPIVANPELLLIGNPRRKRRRRARGKLRLRAYRRRRSRTRRNGGPYGRRSPATTEASVPKHLRHRHWKTVRGHRRRTNPKRGSYSGFVKAHKGLFKRMTFRQATKKIAAMWRRKH